MCLALAGSYRPGACILGLLRDPSPIRAALTNAGAGLEAGHIPMGTGLPR